MPRPNSLLNPVPFDSRFPDNDTHYPEHCGKDKPFGLPIVAPHTSNQSTVSSEAACTHALKYNHCKSRSVADSNDSKISTDGELRSNREPETKASQQDDHSAGTAR